MRTVLFIGPIPPPFNGQSVAFSYLKQLELDNIEKKFHNTQKDIPLLFNYLDSWLILPFKILFSNYNLIYFTCARTKLGFLRQLPFFLSAIIKKIPMINHLHGADFKNFYQQSSVIQPLVRFCFNRIQLSIVLMESMKNEFIDFPNMRIDVVPNAFDFSFNNIRVKLPKPKNILFFSNLMASKGIIYFLEASKILLDLNKEVTINIAGNFVSDHLKKAYQIKKDFYLNYDALKVKYKDRIQYLGLVTGNQKLKLLLNSNIFILPTFYPTEAFPISIIEAMRTGNAIITTKHNYLHEIIDSKNGRLISCHSTEEILDALISLLGDQNLLEQIQAHNIKVSIEQNSITNYLSRIKLIINEAI